MSFKWLKRFLINNFLASTDIKVFGRTYPFAMLLLIGFALFLHPGYFCLASLLQHLYSTLFLNANSWLKNCHMLLKNTIPQSKILFCFVYIDVTTTSKSKTHNHKSYPFLYNRPVLKLAGLGDF